MRIPLRLAGVLTLALMTAATWPSAARAQQPPPPSFASPLQGCASQPVLERFEAFGRSGRMLPELARWLNDPEVQSVAPYQAFDNVHFVGICWVSAWVIRTNAGVILIDTLHEPFVDRLIGNLARVGVDPKDIRYVLMTHGHFDHAGGAARLQALAPQAEFVMTAAGWAEAIASSQASQNTGRPWRFIERGRVVKDGDEIRLGDQVLRIYETPGHTYGTASFSFTVREGAKSWRAFTVGGLGLNAIEGSRQVDAFIASIDRITQLMDSKEDPIEVHLTTHPFSNGLTEVKDRLAGRAPGTTHPLVDPQGFREQLRDLRAGAVERQAIERKREAR